MTNEVDKLKTLISNIKTLITQYETSLVAQVTATVTPTEDLSENIRNSFDFILSSNKDKTLISGYTHPLKWTRNTNCWVKTNNLTGLAVCVYGLGGVGGGTLITRKHVLLSNHVPYPTLPFIVYFVDSNNKTYEYRVIKTKRVSNTDILIGELDNEADPALKVYNVLPTNYTKYFTTSPTFQIIYSDQEKKVLAGNFNAIINTNNEQTVHIVPPSDTTKMQFFETLAVGDSGNPVFTFINNEPVLIGGWYRTWTTTSGLCTNIPFYIGDINNTIASLSPGYKLSEANLSNFKTYN